MPNESPGASERGAGSRGPEVLLPEGVVARLGAREDLLEGETAADVDAELDLDLDVAAAEIAQALTETGRPLRHLHLLRVSAELLGFRRGYVEGARAVATICRAVARDAPKAEGAGPGDG